MTSNVKACLPPRIYKTSHWGWARLAKTCNTPVPFFKKMVVNCYTNHTLSIFYLTPQHYIHTMECYRTFHYKRYTKQKYIVYNYATYRITPMNVITTTMKCPNMDNETICKFPSNIKDTRILNTMRICLNTTQTGIKLSSCAVSTQIGIVILQRYLRKSCNKSSVKHVQTDRNVILNIEPFPLCSSVWPVSLRSSRLLWRIRTLSFALQAFTEYTHHLWYSNKTQAKRTAQRLYQPIPGRSAESWPQVAAGAVIRDTDISVILAGGSVTFEVRHPSCVMQNIIKQSKKQSKHN